MKAEREDQLLVGNQENNLNEYTYAIRPAGGHLFANSSMLFLLLVFVNSTKSLVSFPTSSFFIHAHNLVIKTTPLNTKAELKFELK